MSALVYKDAVILVDGSDISAELNQLDVEIGAEQLDATTFGADTRINRGGLLVPKVSVGGLADFADDLAEQILFDGLGDDNTPIAVFPGGITLGDPCGMAMLGTIAEFTLGGAVGVLTPFSAAFEHQGG